MGAITGKKSVLTLVGQLFRVFRKPTESSPGVLVKIQKITHVRDHSAGNGLSTHDLLIITVASAKLFLLLRLLLRPPPLLLLTLQRTVLRTK